MARQRRTNSAETKTTAITASAKRIDLSDKKQIEAVKKRRSEWQQEAWRYFDTIGEIHFAHTYKRNALSRIRIFAGQQENPDEAPVPYENRSHPAWQQLERLRGPNSTPETICADLAMQLSVAGEGYLVGHQTKDGEVWSVHSIDEVKVNGDRISLITSPDDRDGEPLEADAIFIRVWRAHGRWSALADCSMRAVLDSCDELDLLSRGIRSSARQRLVRAGILTVPEELSYGSPNPTQQGIDGEGRNDQFTQDLLTHFTTAIADEGSASAAVPFILRGKAELLAQVRVIQFEAQFDPIAMQLRAELLKRIAQGIDLPPEVLFGFSNTNHWNAFLISDDTWTSFLEPDMVLVVRALTNGFLRPGLSSDDNRSMIWYDPAGLLTNPDRGTDAKDAYAVKAISSDAYRNYLGFPDNDAPSAQELLVRTVLEKGALTPELTVQLGIDTGLFPPDTSIPADEVVDVNENRQIEVGPTPAQDDNVTVPGTQPELTGAITASARSQRLLARRLQRIEADLAIKLKAKADAAVTRALEIAGAKVRRKAGRGEFAIQIANTAQADVARELGRKVVVDEFGLTEQTLLEDVFDQFELDTQEEFCRASKQIRAALEAEYGDELDFDEIDCESDSKAGATLLKAGLVGLATGLLFDVAVTPTQGEVTGGAVSNNLIRGAMVRAGGFAGQITETGVGVTLDNDFITGILDGPLVSDAIGPRHIERTWIWAAQGEPITPFEPHLNLDGVTFEHWDDAVLANDGAWPPTDYFFPGDHEYCSCGVEVEIVDTKE